MDPNANLEEMALCLENLEGQSCKHERAHTKSRILELCEALNGWILGRGFEPDWAEFPDAARFFNDWRNR